MKQAYQIVDRKDSRALAEFLSREGQLLLPMLELLEQADPSRLRTRMAVDELIDVAGRATIEAVLTLSAQELAGPKHPGKATGSDLAWHGEQPGVVPLAERKLRVSKPRLRRKDKGKTLVLERSEGTEVEIPAYAAMRTQSRLGQRILEILRRGVSTRNYRHVLPEMAETVNVSKSHPSLRLRTRISREFIEASEKALKELMERLLRCARGQGFDDKDILVLYIDGLVFGAHHVIVAIGVDAEGRKHVLGLREGASENATVCMALPSLRSRTSLEDLVERGVKSGRRRRFVIDGSHVLERSEGKALRKAIEALYGTDHPVQRCRNHQRKNVLDPVPDSMKDTVKATRNAAYCSGSA
jgi:hypothetical protein